MGFLKELIFDQSDFRRTKSRLWSMTCVWFCPGFDSSAKCLRLKSALGRLAHKSRTNKRRGGWSEGVHGVPLESMGLEDLADQARGDLKMSLQYM